MSKSTIIPTTDLDAQGKPVKKHAPNSKKPKKKKRPQAIDKIYTRFVRGFYQNIRIVTMYTLFAAFFLAPFMRWDNRQALWFDFGNQHFYIFGLTFMPQDLYYLAWLFIMAAFALFMVTVFAGRVFCGYSCPQTIWVHLFMHIEKWFEGDRNKRIRLDRAPWTMRKLAKRFGKHAVWLLVAFLTATTFVSYVVSTDFLYKSWQTVSLFGLTVPFPEWSGLTWVFVFIFTFATYMNAGWMREQMCFHICPYGRFQSVMFDKDTLIISYDHERGEPRGARKKSKNKASKASVAPPVNTHVGDSKPLGDCIDCKLCVQVCPTGIDIRNGLQMECIQCAACVDACDSIMDKMNYPRGLVRYTTERQLEEHKKGRFIRPKLVAYVVVLSLMFSGFVYMLSARVPVELDVMRDRNQLYITRSDGTVENSYTLKITNKTQQAHDYRIGLQGDAALRLETRWQVVPLEPGESFDVPVSVVARTDRMSQAHIPIVFTATAKDDPKLTATSNNSFETGK